MLTGVFAGCHVQCLTGTQYSMCQILLDSRSSQVLIRDRREESGTVGMCSVWFRLIYALPVHDTLDLTTNGEE